MGSWCSVLKSLRAKLLAIDTTSEYGSIALAEGGRVIEEVLLHSSDGFAHTLFGEIERLLARHELQFGDLDAFAAAAGPGSFTGVRVGLTAAKGLAEATGRRVVAVSNLQALAWFGTRPLRAPVIDARRGEVFGAIYNAELELVQPETVLKFQDWIRTLPNAEIEIVTNGFAVPMVDVPVLETPKALAGAIACVASGRFQAGLAQDPAEIDANYVRRSDAERLWVD
jgi:tRNA threonylcarbamoyladenosine biosynthesis protein TsaB